MPFEVYEEDGGVRLELEGELTIRQAAALAAAVEAIPPDAAIRVGVGGLRDADTSVLQILCSLRRAAPRLTFEPESGAFGAAVARCGLGRELRAGPAEKEQFK